jgi:hypothetical protein
MLAWGFWGLLGLVRCVREEDEQAAWSPCGDQPSPFEGSHRLFAPWVRELGARRLAVVTFFAAVAVAVAVLTCVSIIDNDDGESNVLSYFSGADNIV